MALWNDKRTPPGVVTDTHTGAQGPMGTPSSAWRTPGERIGKDHRARGAAYEAAGLKASQERSAKVPKQQPPKQPSKLAAAKAKVASAVRPKTGPTMLDKAAAVPRPKGTTYGSRRL